MHVHPGAQLQGCLLSHGAVLAGSQALQRHARSSRYQHSLQMSLAGSVSPTACGPLHQE